MLRTHVLPNAAWIPDTLGDDWGGVYDRHLVLDRNLASAGFLNDWDILLHGFAAEWFKEFFQLEGVPLGSAAFHDGVNSEIWLALRFKYSGVSVARFPSIAFVACRQEQWVHHLPSKVPRIVQWGDPSKCVLLKHKGSHLAL